MRLYSSIRASTSVDARIHSTFRAARTMASVRGCSGREKYDAKRFLSEIAFPTYTTRPSSSRKRYAPGASGMGEGSGRATLTWAILGIGGWALALIAVFRHQSFGKGSTR